MNALRGLRPIVLAALLAAACGRGLERERWSILLITIDTLRADHLGCHGYPRATSPNLDGFARESIRFAHAFTTAPKTGPAIASLFTGMYVQHHGVTENPRRLADEHQTLAELMPENYARAAFVANPTLTPARGYAAGFQRYELVGTDSSAVTEAALRWLDAVGSEPYLLWLHYLDPHGPYTPPAELAERFIGDAHYDAARRVPLTYTPIEGLNPQYVLGAVPSYQRFGDVDVVDHYVARYDAEILDVDAHVGRVLAALQASGLASRTLVVITSDHGESLGEDDYFFEHGMFVGEGSVHVPLMIRRPGVSAGRVTQALALSTDLLPTLLRQLSLPLPDDLDGVDLSPVIDDPAAPGPRDWVYACTPYPTEYPFFREMVRTQHARLERVAGGSIGLGEVAAGASASAAAFRRLEPARQRWWTELLDRFGPRTDERGRDVELPPALLEELKEIGYAR